MSPFSPAPSPVTPSSSTFRLAASVAQIADLGARLSVKLFVFSRRIKSADKSIQDVSQDIAMSGAVLQQLGDELSKDENAELVTKEALATVKDLIAGCKSVFAELDSSLDGRVSDHSLVPGWKLRVKFPFLESQVDLPHRLSVGVAAWSNTGDMGSDHGGPATSGSSSVKDVIGNHEAIEAEGEHNTEPDPPSFRHYIADWTQISINEYEAILA